VIRAAVFDLWNTLVRSPGGSPFKQAQAQLRPEQAPLFPELVQDAMGRRHSDAITFLEGWRLRLDLDSKQLEAMAQAFALADAEAGLFPEALDALVRTREHGRIALLSNTQSFDLALLDNLGLREQFRILGLSAEWGVLKPAPAAFEAMQKKLALFPGNLVMVGDSWSDDVQGALDAGWTAIWVNRDRRPRPDHDPEAELVEVADLSLVPDVIARLQAGARCSTCLG
jgi:putative hydrolase of the HAD superfamily